MKTASAKRKTGLNRFGVKRIFQVFFGAFLIAAVLFASAGTLNWPDAWTYMALYLGSILTVGAYVVYKNPEVANTRGKWAGGVKDWDKVLAPLYGLFILAAYVVAGLDFRYSWSSVDTWLKNLGVFGFVPGMVLVYWAMYENSYLATMVKIQKKEGQKVVTTGPYRLVRHPMYLGVLLYQTATPLILGSFAAFLPVLLSNLALVIRTLLEDSTLQKELPGYRKYVEKTRYRLFPGIW